MHPNDPQTTTFALNSTTTTPKSPRGVQQADVWAAADALLAQGQRPTIERVRLHLGRGSPNTVGPLLEGWFAALGERLRLAQSGRGQSVNMESGPAQSSQALLQWVDANWLAEVPAAVVEPALQSLRQIWMLATQEAQSAAQNAVAQQQQQLAARELALENAIAELARREEILREQKRAMDEALALAQQQSQQLTTQLQDMQLIAHERQAQITQLSAELTRERATHEAALRHEREQHTSALAAAAAERERLSEQAQGNERRLLQEIDRTRQDAQRQRQALQSQINTLEAAAEKAQSEHDATLAELQKAQTHASAQAQALSHERERSAHLQHLLDQHLAAQTQPRAQQPVSVLGLSAVKGTSSARAGQSLQRRALSQRNLRKGRGI